MTTFIPPGGASGGDRTRPRVVVGIDGSQGARAALRTALLEAATRDAEVEAVSVYPVVYVWTAGRPIDIRDVDAIRMGTRDRARTVVAEVREELVAGGAPEIGGVPVRVVIHEGQAAPVLVKRAAGADLLVVGSRGRGPVHSLLLGSVALHCVTHAPCPVVVAHGDPGGGPDRGRHVAVGLDGSDGALVALREAVGQAHRRRTELDVLVAYSLADYWTDPYAALGPPVERFPSLVEEEAERLVGTVTAELAQSGAALPPVHLHVVQGSAREVLVEHSAAAAMLVVGSRGHGAFRGVLLGSVALHCVMHADCPVTVVHPDDRLAPLGPAAHPASVRA
jgi:nucleotide-binding universal stress UspA family protein